MNEVMHRVLALLLFLTVSPIWAQDDDYALRHQDSDGEQNPCLPEVDETISLYLICDFADGDALGGWQWGVCHDSDALSLGDGDVVKGSYTDDEDDGGPAVSFSFHAISIVDDGWFIGAYLDVITYTVIEPTDAAEMYCVTYTVEESGDTDVEFCETLGDPLITVRMIVDSTEIEPVNETTSLRECITFLRGDVNNSGVVSAIVDSIYLLNWAFNDDEAPPCMDAADVDDNDEVEALIDALYLLEWGFSSGSPPPDPGPDFCGIDPSEDDLACETMPEECL